MSNSAPGTTNVLLPFAEQHEQWNANEANIRVLRVIDRALVECRDRMEHALRGLEQTPPVAPDMSVLQKGVAKLTSFAKQLNIPHNLVEDELRRLNDEYVAAKSEARAAHPKTGEAGKDVTRAISNAYAMAQARATLIKEALAPYLVEKKKSKKLNDTNEIELAPQHAPQEGDTGDATQVGGASAEDIDITVGDTEDPLDGADIDAWLKEEPDAITPTLPFVKPAATPPAKPAQVTKPNAPAIKKASTKK